MLFAILQASVYYRMLESFALTMLKKDLSEI